MERGEAPQSGPDDRMADAGHDMRPRTGQGGRLEAAERGEPGFDAQPGGVALWLEHPSIDGRDERRPESGGRQSHSRRGDIRLADSELRDGERERAGAGTVRAEDGPDSPWSRAALIECRDGKFRRISAQSGDEPLAYGIPRQLGPALSGLGSVGVRAARSNRVGRLKGYGNAIVPQVAAEFIRAFMECRASS